VVEGSKFGKDLERQKKRGKDMAKLQEVLAALVSRRGLEARHRDHALTGDMKGYRECHVEPDRLLVYQYKGEDELYLARTGSHSDLKLA
jgi:mRNA interferase YafQ